MGRPRIDLVELALLGAFAAFSMWVVALDLWQVLVHDRSWTGTDGGYGLPDQMQHLAWVRDASSHVLISNLFILEDTSHNYLQPAVVVSAALTALGLAPWLGLMLWKPVAVVWAFFAVRAYVHRSLEGRGARYAAIALALFFVGWGALLAEKIGPAGSVPDVGWLFHTNDAWLAFWSWGYLFGLLSIATLVSGLLAYARDREEGRIGWGAPVLGALTGWLHPWQGEIFILILVVAEALMWVRGGRPRLRLPALTLLASALPFAYYLVLRQTDLSWRVGQDTGRHAWPLVMVTVTLLPLALPAALAYRDRVRGFLPLATRVWVPVTLVLYLVNETSLGRGPTHSLLGVTIPLAVLSVEGARRLGGRLPARYAWPVGALVLAALILPPMLNAMWDRKVALFRDASTGANANFIASDERRALDFLAADDRAGGVFTGPYLGTVVPALTGRHTFVGNYFWSRGYFERVELTERLFTRSSDGSEDAEEAASQVAKLPGARFVLADCRATNDLRRALAGMVESAHPFGCATVYVLKARL